MSATSLKLGNTYRFTTTFRAFSTGALTDVTGDVLLKIYDSSKVQVGSSVTATKPSTGVYYADWTTTTEGCFFWTMSGTLSGSVALDGGEVVVTFI